MELPAPFGKYELIERIATGGMAEVFLARCFGVAGFEKRLVIKRIRPELARDPRFVQMFIHEAKISVHLNHPNVVQVYDLGKVRDSYFMAMEHLHGRDLTRLVKTLRAEDLRLPVPVCCAIVAELLRGLHYAHTRTDVDGTLLGLVHRDVSPHNVVVTFDGSAKLVDFGVARLMNTAQSEADGERRGPGGGKYAYMSPEQARGDRVDLRSDTFSAGIVLWELIVGRRLFQDADPSEKLRLVTEAVIPHPSELGAPIDEDLWAILQRALARDRDDRYPNAALFEEALRAWIFQNGEPAGASQIASWLRTAFPEDAQRSPTAVSLRRMVADLERLDRVHDDASDGTHTPTHGTAPGLPRSDGERKPVTVLVIDVDGLTDLSIRLDPEDLFKRQYRLLRQIRRAVLRFGGAVQRAVDDQIIVVFGAPRTRDDDPLRALECARALQDLVPDLRRRGIPIRLAVGAHTGEMTVAMGAHHKLRYFARGDTTRLARRLSAVADHAEVLCSQAVLDATRGEFRFTPGPPVPNRGGRPATPSYLLEQRRRSPRLSASGTWMRRGHEVEVIRDALVRLGRGQGSAIVVTGSLGAGKSRLLSELRDLARRRGLPFFVGRVSPPGMDPPMEAFRELVRQIAGLDERAEDAPARVAALSQLGLGREELDIVGAFIGVIPDGGSAPDRRDTTAEAAWYGIERLFSGLSTETPLVLALEDVDRLSVADSQRWRHLVEATRDLPLLWFVTHRDPLASRYADIGTVIRLGAFDPAAQRRLVASLLGVRSVDEAIFALIDRTCEGNPLYLEEMLRFLLRDGHITTNDDHAALAGTLSGPALPSSINALVTARLDALDPASKGVLQLAATIGADFSETLVAEAAGLDNAGVALADLTAHGLIGRVEPGRWAFVSELVRESVLHGIFGVQRRDQHGVVAAAIERLHADNLGPWLESLTRHCSGAGRHLDAARYAMRAGAILASQQHLDRALTTYSQGLADLARVPEQPDTWDVRTQGEATLHQRIGTLQCLMDNPAQGERALQVALDIASDAGLPWIEIQAHIQLGKSYLMRGKPALAEAHLRQGEALLQVDPDDEMAFECLETRAKLAFSVGDDDKALTLWREAMLRAADDPQAAARCLVGLANRHLRAGAGADARPLLDEALIAARSAGDRILEGRVLNNMGLIAALDDDYDAATAFFRRALQTREGIGYAHGAIVNHHNIGDAHLNNGDLPRAHVAFARSRELAVAMRWERGVAMNDIYLGYLDAAFGRAEDGLRRIADAREVARRLGDVEVDVTGAWLTGRWLLEAGRPDDAQPILTEGLRCAEAFGLASTAAILRNALT